MQFIVILPLIWEVNGVWLAVPVAEAMALVMSIIYLVKYGKKYGYALGRGNENITTS